MLFRTAKKEKFYTIGSDIDSMITFLQKQQHWDTKLHLTFEISGQAGYLYDTLADHVDTITVSNPSKMTWIYRTAKKNDRIDARKQALLLSIREIPKVHIPDKTIRQWRETILHRRNLIGRAVQVKNRIRAVLKSQGLTKPLYSGSWWKKENRTWMHTLIQKRWSSGYVADRWRMDYNHYRPHSSLDYMAPAAFATQCLEQGSATLRLPQDRETMCDILS